MGRYRPVNSTPSSGAAIRNLRKGGAPPAAISSSRSSCASRYIVSRPKLWVESVSLGKVARSRTSTRWPRRARCRAVSDPATRAPTTMASQICIPNPSSLRSLAPTPPPPLPIPGEGEKAAPPPELGEGLGVRPYKGQRAGTGLSLVLRDRQPVQHAHEDVPIGDGKALLVLRQALHPRREHPVEERIVDEDRTAVLGQHLVRLVVELDALRLILFALGLVDELVVVLVHPVAALAALRDLGVEA